MIAPGLAGCRSQTRPAALPDTGARGHALPASAHLKDLRHRRAGTQPRFATGLRPRGRALPRPGLLLPALLALALWGSGSPAQTLPDFTALVAEHGPAVVNISTSARKRVASARVPEGYPIPDLPEDSPYYEFFRRFFFGAPEQDYFDTQSLGSGFIISSDGYVICNYHVIRNADEITVRLSDRREFKAEIVGVDERSDIGLLKIDAPDLPAVLIGSGYELQVGEWVLAIGSPFGFDHSVTAGIVSAKGRSLPRDNYVPFIQTDVAINPGNSGGPLFNLRGEVVGINSQIFSRTGGFMGLSFAIPIEVAMDVAAQLREQGRVSRGWLGVLIDDVSPELAASFEMDRPRGAWIAKVLPDGPAAAAGFRENDIVLEFNGNPVHRSSDLPPIVGRTRVGTRVAVKILRDAKALTLYVLTAELPGEEEIRLAAGRAPAPAAVGALGLSVVDPTALQRRQWGLPEHGVLVTEIEEGPAHRAGLRPGDVILTFGGVDVNDVEAFLELAGRLPQGEVVSILAQRQGDPIALALEAD